MNLTALIQFEYKVLWNEFKISLRDRRYIAAYLIVFSTMISFYFGTWLVIETGFILDSLAFLDLDVVAQNFVIVFPVWMIYATLKGLNPTSVTSLFSPPDMTLIFPGPVSSNDVYLSKFIKSVFRHIGLLFLFFISFSPIFLSAKLGIIETLLLFSFVLIFYEITQLVSHVEFFIISRYIRGDETLFDRKNIVQILFLLLIVGLSTVDVLFVKTGFNIFAYLTFLFRSPELFINHIFFSKGTIQICTKCIVTYGLTFFGLLLISYWNARGYYELFSQNDPSVRHRRISINISNLDLTYQDSKFKLLFTKDLMLLLRNFGGLLFLNIAFVYCMAAIFIIYYGEIIASFDKVLVFYGAPFLYILFNQLKFFPDEVVNREWGGLWILRTSNTSQQFLVQTKVMFGYILSAVFTMPFLASLIVVNERDWYFLAVLILNLLLLNTPIRLLASSYFSIGSDNFIDSFLSNFLQVLGMFILCLLYMQMYFTSTSMMFIYSTILVSFLITRFGAPIKYYVLDLISNAYLFALLSSIVLGSLILILALVRTSFLVQNWSIFLRLMWYTAASLLTTSLVLRQIIKWTQSFYIE